MPYSPLNFGIHSSSFANHVRWLIEQAGMRVSATQSAIPLHTVPFVFACLSYAVSSRERRWFRVGCSVPIARCSQDARQFLLGKVEANLIWMFEVSTSLEGKTRQAVQALGASSATWRIFRWHEWHGVFSGLPWDFVAKCRSLNSQMLLHVVGKTPRRSVLVLSVVAVCRKTRWFNVGIRNSTFFKSMNVGCGRQINLQSHSERTEIL